MLNHRRELVESLFENIRKKLEGFVNSSEYEAFVRRLAEKADKESLKLFKDKLSAWLLVFGIDTEKLCSQSAGSNDDEIDQLVKKRDEARKNKDWATSDQIRDQLKEMGITIQDTPQGTRWTRD